MDDHFRAVEMLRDPAISQLLVMRADPSTVDVSRAVHVQSTSQTILNYVVINPFTLRLVHVATPSSGWGPHSGGAHPSTTSPVSSNVPPLVYMATSALPGMPAAPIHLSIAPGPIQSGWNTHRHAANPPGYMGTFTFRGLPVPPSSSSPSAAAAGFTPAMSLPRLHVPSPSMVFRVATAQNRGDDRLMLWPVPRARLLQGSDRQRASSYPGAPHRVAAPITRLPTELLIRIFALAAPTYQTIGTPWRRRSERNILRVLKQRHLFRFAAVCAVWRAVALNTPLLWDVIELDLSALRMSPTQKHRSPLFLQTALRIALQRAQRVPLTLHLHATVPISSYHWALLLLIVRSNQWRELNLVCDEYGGQWLDLVQGRLSSLRNVAITGKRLDRISALEVAPQLISAMVSGLQAPALPWTQLGKVSLNVPVAPPGNTLLADVLPALSGQARASLELKLDVFDDVSPLEFRPLLSHVARFLLRVSGAHMSPERALNVLTSLLSGITFHCLAKFGLQTPPGQSPLPWPATSFMDLSARSSFGTTVRNFELRDIIVSEADLLECLTELKALEVLTLVDVIAGARGHGEHIVITDTVLRRLIFVQDEAECLIPNLNFFQCISLLRFTDSVMVAFVRSRVGPGRCVEHPFYVGLNWHKGYGREIEFSELSELDKQGQLIMFSGPYPTPAPA